MPVRRSERRAGLVNRRGRCDSGDGLHFNFRAVKSGLLRLISAWLSVRVRPFSQWEGSSMVEHVNIPWSVFSRHTLSGSEDEATSPPRRIAAASPFPPARWDAKTSACRTRERCVGRAPGAPLVCFSPENLFLGSEGEVTSLETNPMPWCKSRRTSPVFLPELFSEEVSERILRKTRSSPDESCRFNSCSNRRRFDGGINMPFTALARFARSCGLRLRRPHLRFAPSPLIQFRGQ